MSDHGHQHLQREFLPAGEPQVAPLHHFRVVVDEADGRETQQREDGDPHVEVAEIGPEQRGHDDGDDDQDAAHGRRAGFLLVAARTFFANVLSDLEFAQLGDQPGSQRDAQKQRGDAGESRAQREVAKDAEAADGGIELLVEKVVEHG